MLDDHASSLPDLRSSLEEDVRKILISRNFEDGSLSSHTNWEVFLSDSIARFLESSASKSAASTRIWQLGASSLQTFLQATVTGPPLDWDPWRLLVTQDVIRQFDSSDDKFRHHLRSGLSIDGEAVYRLLPFVELFVFAKCLLNHSLLEKNEELRIWRLRVNVWHQRLLSEISPSLQETIYRDVDSLSHISTPAFLIERASIHILHGFDTKARIELELAGKVNGFQYVLTGRLGKRTRFQEKELSQLVVLAKSETGVDTLENSSGIEGKAAPDALQLNDDTLLESISFSKQDSSRKSIDSEDSIPASLAALNPSDQPLLKPLDSIILLNTASTITNTSPQDGLTREETLPYIERVLNGGSSNWQVYTQALIIRSRIEGYRSRTAERGVLQLQALVDQVIAETTSKAGGDSDPKDRPTTFLPKPEAQESAPASDRLQYIHLLASPPRWKLEAELADRWVSLGALRTALEIYERLELWAEVALCWAANDREDKARLIIRRQVYDRSDTAAEDESPAAYTKERDPLPNDAPRLFCILGDLDKSAQAYERAWEVSNKRYARAQRSLGRLYLSLGQTKQADEAYSKSLEVNPQNHGTWFALGCVRLQLEAWSEAATAFTRAVQIDDSDAESWSNLAVSVLKLSDVSSDDEYGKAKLIKDSFNALKRAANLKRDSSKIWQNLLSVAIKLQPPPYTDIVIAQSRLIDLLGHIEGEKCIDVPILEALLADVIRMSQVHGTETSVNGGKNTTGASDEANNDTKAVINERARSTGLEKMLLDLIRKKITPMITSSRRLWLLTAKMHIYLHHPHAALTAYEKAWRSQLNKPGWDSSISSGSNETWKEVGESTIDLIDAYESLGERTREAGMGEGDLVAKDWKFKARSAARSVLSRAKDAWEEDELYEKLSGRLQDLKSG